MALTRDNFIGLWAGLPVAWKDDDRFHEAIYRSDVAQCCETGISGVYSGGSTGEFYAMSFEEFEAVARATVEEAHRCGKPAMVGCTAAYTLGVLKRAAYAMELGADAIQLSLPFWMEMPDISIIPFFKEIARAIDGLPFSIYETVRTKKPLTVEQHRAIKETAPNYTMVKANKGTVGATPDGCRELSAFVNVFVQEGMWSKLCPHGAIGSCSAWIYYNPRVLLSIWQYAADRDWDGLAEACVPLQALDEFLASHFGAKGFTDTSYDRMGGVASGFLCTSLRNRGPYPCATREDVATLRRWYKEHFPEMLQLAEEPMRPPHWIRPGDRLEIDSLSEG